MKFTNNATREQKNKAFRKLCKETFPGGPEQYFQSYYTQEIERRGLREEFLQYADYFHQSFAFMWAADIGDRDKMKEVVLKSKDPGVAYLWGSQLGDRDEMKALILEVRNAKYALEWALELKFDERFKEIVLESEDSRSMCVWAYAFEKDRSEMFGALLRLGDPYGALLWMEEIGAEGQQREELKQVVVRSGSPKFARIWAIMVGDRDEMYEIVKQSGDIENLEAFEASMSDAWRAKLYVV